MRFNFRVVCVAPVLAYGAWATNQPVRASIEHQLYQHKISQIGYKEQYGSWSQLNVPQKFRINAIHAALLYTGKVLIIAGSGNKQGNFERGSFRSIIYDPATNKFRSINTPDDMFCGGHAYLPDGKLLIAGGTSRYEVLKDRIKRAAGVVSINNLSLRHAIRLKKHTHLISANGSVYISRQAVVVKPAIHGQRADGRPGIVSGFSEVWATAVKVGKGEVVTRHTSLKIAGLTAATAKVARASTGRLSLDKQDYWGDNKSYLFDPASESYQRVGDMNFGRWYPTLTGIGKGKVMAVSGLDAFGRMIQGQNEVYQPQTKTWTVAPRLQRTFPTYPALFPMMGGNLFYSGSNAGYGSPDVGRDPGIWDLSDNSFMKVPGMRDSKDTETSGSVLLPPAQRQKVAIVGGGGVGESADATSRIDVVDLLKSAPAYQPSANLPKPNRYPSLVITPDDKVVISGGSSNYRGKGKSDLLLCHLYDPSDNNLKRVADPTVGRNYHSEALLLPDGRIMTMGSDPLFNDAQGFEPGTFEQRIEIYSPPYLFHGVRPVIENAPLQVQRGGSAYITATNPADIASARLIRPSAVTHVTDVEQRSIALKILPQPLGASVTIPRGEGLVPSGWYMLFVNNKKGVPSEGRWIHVV